MSSLRGWRFGLRSKAGLWLLVSVLALAVSVVACDREGPPAVAEPEPTAPPTSATATSGKSSCFMNSDVSYVIGQGLDVKAKMRSPQAGPTDVQFGMVVVGNDIYVRVGAQEWVLLDQATAQQVGGERMLGQQTQAGLPFITSAVPWPVFAIEDLGAETVDGVPVRRLSYDFDMPTVWGHMTAGEKEDLARFYLPDELTPQNLDELAGMMDVKKVEVWLDAEGFSRRTILELSLKDATGANGAVAVWSDTRMSRFNEPLTIEPPSAFQKLEDVASGKITQR